jgi:hypothetical protein
MSGTAYITLGSLLGLPGICSILFHVERVHLRSSHVHGESEEVVLLPDKVTETAFSLRKFLISLVKSS